MCDRWFGGGGAARAAGVRVCVVGVAADKGVAAPGGSVEVTVTLRDAAGRPVRHLGVQVPFLLQLPALPDPDTLLYLLFPPHGQQLRHGAPLERREEGHPSPPR